MNRYIIGLIILIIIICIVYYKRKQNQLVISVPLNGIIIKRGQTIDISPNIKISYKPDGDICLNYKYKDTGYTHCETLYKPTNDSESLFAVIDSKLIFESYIGDPNGTYYMTNLSGFSIGLLAGKMSDAVYSVTHDDHDKTIVYNNIVNSVKNITHSTQQ